MAPETSEMESSAKNIRLLELEDLVLFKPIFIIHLYKSQVFFFFFLIWNGDIGYSLIGFLWELTEIIRKKYFVNSKS